MKSILAASLFIAFTSLGAASAQTQTASSVVPETPSPQARYQSKTIYCFPDDDIDVSLPTPQGETIQGRRLSRQSTLIPVRSSFLPEMLKSVEAL